MNNAEQWISLKDQQPGDDQFPVWYANQPAETVWHSDNLDGYQATHWKQAERRPAPPPRAKTLAELDADAFKAWRGTFPRYAIATYEMAFKAGIAYERAEIAKIIRQINKGHASVIAELDRRTEGKL